MLKILHNGVLGRVVRIVRLLPHKTCDHLTNVRIRPPEQTLQELRDHSIGLLVAGGARVGNLGDEAPVRAAVRDRADFDLKVADLVRAAHAFNLKLFAFAEDA